MAYSPIARGLLTGMISAADDLEEDDRRRDHPRFAPENIVQNDRLLEALHADAMREGCTVAQLAIASLLSRGDDIVPIPGTRWRRWLVVNAAAVDLTISLETLAPLEDTFRSGVAVGPAILRRR